MDNAIRIPGTSYRVGLDPIVGLLPGVGDVLGLAVAAYPLIEARRLGVGKRVLLRMVGNVAVDAAVGAVPLLGDLFDAAFKANVRNLRLLEKELGADRPDAPRRRRRDSRSVLAARLVRLEDAQRGRCGCHREGRAVTPA